MDLLTWTPDDNNPERWRAAFGGSHGGPGIEFGVYYLAANDGGRGLFHLLVTLRFYDFSRLQEHEVHRDAYKEADESKAAAERWLRDWLGAAGAAAMRARAVELLRDERTEAQVALAIAAFAEAMLAGDAAEVDP